jgi:hypothetical protein
VEAQYKSGYFFGFLLKIRPSHPLWKAAKGMINAVYLSPTIMKKMEETAPEI